jgi:arsenate reductase
MASSRVLVLCTGNSARSVIAEALLRECAGGAFEVQSAGTHPKGINPFTTRVLVEERIPLEGFRSKSVDEFAGQHFDYVITVCDSAAEECPVFPGAPVRLHWSFPDPAAVGGSEDEKLAAFRDTVRGMRGRVQQFVALVRGVQTASGKREGKKT